MERKYTTTAISVLFGLLLLLSLKANVFRIADPEIDRSYFYMSTRSLIEAKLAHMDQGEGWFEKSFLHVNSSLFFRKSDPFDPDKSKAYTSSLGLQGGVFALIKHISNWESAWVLEISEWVASFFVTALIVLFCRELALKFGWVPTLPGVLLFLFSVHLIFFARNAYWMVALLLLPGMIIASAVVRYPDISPYYRQLLFFWGLAVLLKCLTGYEFITNIFLSASPFILFDDLRSNRRIPQIIKNQMAFVVVAGLAFAFSYALHIGLLAYKEGGVQTAWTLVSERVVQNTVGAEEKVSSGVNEKYFTPYFGRLYLLLKFLSFQAVNIGVYPPFGDQNYYMVRATYFGLVGASLVAAMTSFILSRHTTIKSDRYGLSAIALCLPWSIVCSLLWIIMARSHCTHREAVAIFMIFPFFFSFAHSAALMLSVIRPNRVGD
jgi:hypothetical protein